MVTDGDVPGRPGRAGGALDGLREAVAFLTPVGGAAAPVPRALLWFPAVGALIGFAVGAAWWAAHRAWPAVVAGAIAVAADLALTGLLHFDGLCDAADGLLAPLDRARRLEVMAQPDIGAFGAGVAGVTLLLRWAALAVLAPGVLLVVGLWTASRTWMAAVAVALPYARPEGGLATAFREGGPGPAAVRMLAAGGVLAALLLAAAWRPVVGPAAVLIGTVVAGAVVLLAWRRLGGFTGDVLGAAGMVGETVGLLAACARW